MLRFSFTKKCTFILFYLFYTLTAGFLFAQTVSRKKDIAVFRLAQSDAVPTAVAAGIDQRITGVITSFKRFNVIGLQYRLRSADVSSFIEKIKELRENQSEIPETVLSGEEAFTRADWERLTGAFLVFVPEITSYNEAVIYEDAVRNGKKVVKTYWEVKVKGALTIIDVSGETMGQRVLPLSAETTSSRRSTAIDSVIDSLASSVHTAIKFEPEFALASGIIAVDRNTHTVTIEMGKDMGVREGDEYVLQKPVFVGGKQSLIETGFLIISKVYDSFSTGKVIYANEPIVEGDTVTERPHHNFILQGYGGITVPMTGVTPNRSTEYLRVQPTFGIRGIYGGTFHVSFLFGYEYAIQQPLGKSAALSEKPLKFSPFGMGYLGMGVYNFYAGRFKISPELQFCLSGSRVYSQSPASKKAITVSAVAPQLGGRVLVSADYFITRRWTAGISAGLGYMHGLLKAQRAGELLKTEGMLTAAETETIGNYSWDILSSHLNTYLFIGITGRF